jgi:hypothetical protein
MPPYGCAPERPTVRQYHGAQVVRQNVIPDLRFSRPSVSAHVTRIVEGARADRGMGAN